MSKYAGNSTVKLIKPQRSQFDLSHMKRLTTRMGRLTPCFIQETVPSDTFNGSTEILVRLAPLLAPIYDQIHMFVHFYFVPNRLLWEEWETFITGGRLGVGIEPNEAPIPPFCHIRDLIGMNVGTGAAKSSLADYLGVPIFQDLPGYVEADYTDIPMDVMPFLAYSRCWYDYYRDRNFVADTILVFPVQSDFIDPGAGINPNYFTVQTRNYEHDYFTSALPFTQRGEEVLMPLAGTGSVSYLATSEVRRADGTDPAAGDVRMRGQTSGNLTLTNAADVSTFNARIENIDEVTLDSSSVSINDFRSAYALQVWLERNAIGGSRYNESTQAHFGVRPQDSRLQRAEYIGGGRIPIEIREVVSTAYSDDGAAIVPLANLAGHGRAYGNTNSFHYFCPEHGFIIGILSIMNPPSYHQGLPRMFRRRTFLDYPWPTFAKLGEQTVDKYELFASAVNLTENDAAEFPLFGYQSRYADWKQVQNSNHGEFHDTLLFWTLTREFAGSPTLSTAFNLFDSTTQDRIFAVNGTSDNFWCYVSNKITVRRPLPYFGTPNTLGF